MIASTILFKLPLDSDWEALSQRAYTRAKEYYVTVPGLRTKAFVFNKETGEYGGMYVWEDKKYLDEFLLSDAYKGSVEKLGQPEVKIFDVPAFIQEGKLQE